MKCHYSILAIFIFATFATYSYAGPNAIQITPLRNLFVGQISQGTLTSTFTQNIRSGVTKRKSGDAEVVLGSSYTGQYQLTAAPNSRIQIRTFGDPTLTGPGTAIVINEYKPNKGNSRIDSTGILYVNNAADFTVGPNQALGTYLGTYYIRARYRNPIPAGETSAWVVSAVQTILLESVMSGTIGINEMQELQFGEIGVDPAGGAVRLNNTGMVNVSGSSVFSGFSKRAKFKISGTPGATVYISTSTGDVLSGPGTDIQLSDFTGFTSSRTLHGSTGLATINVGAKLTFGANQAPGAYVGTYSINVNY